MVSRVAFSGENVDITAHAFQHTDMEKALRLYFSPSSPLYLTRFAGDTVAEVTEMMQERLDELDRSSALTVLGATEAAFRIDYLTRCYEKQKDDLSRAFREIHKEKGSKASLDRDIFDAWQVHEPAHKATISALKGAFNFRHWLAHGRYWDPKLGRKYDYITCYGLAAAALSTLPFVE
ncbi:MULTISPECIES: hypothetical protein [unclassified Neorhizobium]|uniref:hypothetical protein n=1 Tax=unclassified Neorhizobium TaxID=2629175 RepID=UPI001FF119A6|nr:MULTISPECIES: hypothetical protein [unclassified Neorhizobium]MCJ9674009.1 hypothetical protein [Neorhizobium sp. SHOUNA12B]MCJ9746011.1 hypothetical protein [Neorhizobium sp. SHOUNA12A]